MAEINGMEEKVHVDETVEERRGQHVNTDRNWSGKTETGASSYVT